MTEYPPREITQRQLRNDSDTIMRGVERGESFTITRNGTPIRRLIPLRRRTFVPQWPCVKKQSCGVGHIAEMTSRSNQDISTVDCGPPHDHLA